MTEEFTDRETGTGYATAGELVNEYIDKFSKAISAATGMQIRFDPLDSDGFTSVSRGSATVGINVVDEQGILIFVSRIMKVPVDKKEECFRLLLELNYMATSDGAFAIEKETDTICLRAQRSVAGLDYEEFEEMLHSVGTVADEWDDRLMDQFS